MDFRWVAVIALWTLLIGPVLGPPLNKKSRLSPSRAVMAQELTASGTSSR